MSFELDNELNKFYLDDHVKKSTQLNILEKADLNAEDYAEDDLLLTNAIKDDKIGDDIDKGRYQYTKIRAFDINSLARYNTNLDINFDKSIYSTGNSYTNEYIFTPYKLENLLININGTNNRINIRIKNANSNETHLYKIFLSIRKKTFEELETELINKFLSLNITCSLYIDIFNDIINCILTCTNQFVCTFFNEDIDFLQSNNYLCNDYKIYINNTIKNVKVIRLMSSYFKNSYTVINKYNNYINIKINDINYTYTIPIGNYNFNIDNIFDQLIIGLNDLIFGETLIPNFFSYSFDGNINSIVISGIMPFIIDFAIDFEYIFHFEKSLNYITEYRNIPNIINLLPFNYIFIKLNDYNNLYDTLSDNYYFMKIVFSDNIIYNHSINYTIESSESSTISYFHVQIYDYKGNKLDPCLDHSFTVEIINSEDRLVGTNIESNRSNYKLITFKNE